MIFCFCATWLLVVLSVLWEQSQVQEILVTPLRHRVGRILLEARVKTPMVSQLLLFTLATDGKVISPSVDCVEDSDGSPLFPMTQITPITTFRWHL
jgi:hypothetical protein